jgi:hypothetical protein
MIKPTTIFYGLLKLFSLVLIAGILTAGCRSAKKITTAIAKKDTLTIKKPDSAAAANLKADSVQYIKNLYHHIEGDLVNCNTFSAKMKVHYEGSDGKDYEFNAFLRLEKDKVIWVSINALLGVEAFRVLITPDSVKVLYKLDKAYQLRSVGYLQEVTHLPFDFQTLQALLLGNPIYLDSNIVFYRKDEKGISLLSEGKLFRNYITLDNTDLRIRHSKLDDVDRLRARSCDLTYGDYEAKDNLLFSTFRKIAVAEKARLDIELNFKQYNFNQVLSFPFNIPKNYKQK